MSFLNFYPNIYNLNNASLISRHSSLLVRGDLFAKFYSNFLIGLSKPQSVSPKKTVIQNITEDQTQLKKLMETTDQWQSEYALSPQPQKKAAARIAQLVNEEVMEALYGNERFDKQIFTAQASDETIAATMIATSNPHSFGSGSVSSEIIQALQKKECEQIWTILLTVRDLSDPSTKGAGAELRIELEKQIRKQMRNKQACVVFNTILPKEHQKFPGYSQLEMEDPAEKGTTTFFKKIFKS